MTYLLSLASTCCKMENRIINYCVQRFCMTQAHIVSNTQLSNTFCYMARVCSGRYNALSDRPIFREEGILTLVFFKLLVFVDGRKPEKSPLD